MIRFSPTRFLILGLQIKKLSKEILKQLFVLLLLNKHHLINSIHSEVTFFFHFVRQLIAYSFVIGVCGCCETV